MIEVLYYLLAFFVPLAFWPATSELFEFNKTVLVYLLTTFIILFWIIKTIKQRKIIFRRTILDIPLLLFLGSQFISTFISFDLHTSLLGYYSRFNGGLILTLCYSLLYWGLVSNLSKESVQKMLKFLLASGLLVSIYGILQHFGIDKDIWVQDVQNRIFSTLGQPNWLGTWIAALIPLIFIFVDKVKGKGKIIPLTLSTIFFLTLLYTKSRSAILGFLIGIIFLELGLFIINKNIKQVISGVATFIFPLLLTLILVGSPWTKSLYQLFTSPQNVPVTPKAFVPALEAGGTESGEIRKIVWKGAFEIWKHHPIFGTGVETFAYSYYQYRPDEHNLVSEWDFLYNKAHNEYLNLAANSGLVGLLTYLLIYFVLGIWILKIIFNKDFDIKNKLSILALSSGLIINLVSNFFGFSVIATSIQTTLFLGAIIIFGSKDLGTKSNQLNLTLTRWIMIIISTIISIYVGILVINYWRADYFYNLGKVQNESGDYVNARENLIKAVKLSPNESVFWNEMAKSAANIAVILSEDNNQVEAEVFSNYAIKESDQALTFSPKNINFKKNKTIIYLKLANIDSTYISLAEKEIISTLTLSPNDPKLYYNLGLTQSRTGQIEKSLASLEKSISLKPDYREPRYALALILINQKKYVEAKFQLNYILEKIAPKDEVAKKLLQEINLK